MNRLINASAHDTGLEPGSVHCIVTSPPYWGLRKYQGDQGIQWPAVDYSPMPGLPRITIPAMQCDLGQEPSPEAYIGHLMLVMREMWRVLRDDGTCWVNLGDSYNGSGGAGGDYNEGGNKHGQPKYKGRKDGNLKPKDKVMIPARFALAAQADGWYVRSDMPWLKRSGMPESATDRPTQAIEYVYLLAKSPKYYFDAEAIKQPVAESSIGRLNQDIENQIGSARANGGAKTNGNIKAAGDVSGRLFRSSDLFFKTFQGAIVEDENPLAMVVNPSGYSGAHFATWPERLVEPMILAGTSAHGVCSECGAPWVRVVEKTGSTWEARKEAGAPMRYGMNNNKEFKRGTGLDYGNVISSTTGWQPSCKCENNQPIPATVLDCFNGSGTSGRCANRLGRDYIGVDISEQYLTELAPERMGNLQIEMSW